MISTRTEDLLSIVRLGLQPRAVQPLKIIVVGAGMAGLVAAYELQRAGHQLTVLEARERIGGRIQTLREPFSNGLYAEAGAMRLPSTHKLIQTYIQKFGLQTTEFTGAGPNAFFYVNGRRRLRREVERDPACLGFNFAGPNGDQTVLQLWAELLRHTTQQLKADEGYWNDMVRRYERFSLYDFLRSQQWSTEAITAFALVEGLEGVLGLSFLELLKVELAWQGASMSQIVGGMDQLPKAFLPEMQSRIQFGAEMVALDYTSDSVTVHYKSQTGLEQVTGDFAILAVPYPTLRFVDVLKPFSPGKQMALRQLHYMDVVKVFLQCRRRFWEDDDGIFGGATITDLPIQLVFYPDHGRETKQGVLMGCFALGEAANRWASLSPEDRITQALKYVGQVHPQVTKEFEVGVSKVWSEDQFAGGGVAAYEPGQQAVLYPHMITPEGPIHFAGEHASSKHFWIEGAVESGLRAAQEVHERSFVAASQ
jgi:monoamine oxidase